LKVLHVGPKNFPPDHGGVEKVVYDIITAMPQVQSYVLAEWHPASRGEHVCVLEKGFLPAVRQIRDFCRARAVDVVHLHKETFIPHALLLQTLGLRCILTIHGCAWRLARWIWYYRAALFLFDCLACVFLRCVVFVGRHDREFFKKLIFFRRLPLIGNGVTSYDIHPADRAKRLVYLGRLSPEKNILGLIRAAEKAHLDLDLYGPFDKHDPEFQQTSLRLLDQCKHAVWKGPIPSQAVQSTLAGYSTFVSLSFSEGMPVSVLEAASVGLRLILSDIPQHRLLRFPSCTYVSPHNPELDESMVFQGSGELNRTHAQDHFSVERMADQYLSLYRELAHERQE
jgi:glycosyltransferase involved in cell wall biosynthesis